MYINVAGFFLYNLYVLVGCFFFSIDYNIQGRYLFSISNNWGRIRNWYRQVPTRRREQHWLLQLLSNLHHAALQPVALIQIRSTDLLVLLCEGPTVRCTGRATCRSWTPPPSTMASSFIEVRAQDYYFFFVGGGREAHLGPGETGL